MLIVRIALPLPNVQVARNSVSWNEKWILSDIEGFNQFSVTSKIYKCEPNPKLFDISIFIIYLMDMSNKNYKTHKISRTSYIQRHHRHEILSVNWIFFSKTNFHPLQIFHPYMELITRMSAKDLQRRNISAGYYKNAVLDTKIAFIWISPE